MKNKPQKRRYEILHPGLKQLTPIEKRKMETRIASDRERWNYLFSLNKWVLIK